MTLATTLAKAAAIALLLVPATAFAQEDFFGVPGPIQFEGQDYALAWSSNPSKGYIKHEYVPSGQSVEAYDRMVIIETVEGAITPMQAAVAQIQSLEQRKASDPLVNHELIQNDSTGEIILDFLVSDLAANPTIVEWNAYRYSPLPGKDGVVLFAISQRGYGDDGGADFLGALPNARPRMIGALAAQPLPAGLAPR